MSTNLPTQIRNFSPAPLSKETTKHQVEKEVETPIIAEKSDAIDVTTPKVTTDSPALADEYMQQDVGHCSRSRSPLAPHEPPKDAEKKDDVRQDNR